MEKAPSLCIVNLYLPSLPAGKLQYFARTIKLHSGYDHMNIELLLPSPSPTPNLDRNSGLMLLVQYQASSSMNKWPRSFQKSVF